MEVIPELKRQFQSLALRHRYASQARENVLVEVVEGFDTHNIQLILLKGAALANIIYTKPEYRPMRDIDILVSESQQAKAKRVLEKMGFEFEKSHASIYMGGIHHLPNAIKRFDGFNVSIEVHHEIYSRDVEGSQHIEQVIGTAQMISINKTRNALALGHLSMLNHLSRHTFSQGSEVRLIHQYDILSYAEKHFDEIPWHSLKQQNHFIFNTIRCLRSSLYLPEKLNSLFGGTEIKKINGIGKAMLPYTHILSKNKSFFQRWNALFSPSPWWMHVNYNIAPEKSLIWCYLFTQPKKVFVDISMRLFYAAKNTLRKIK